MHRALIWLSKAKTAAYIQSRGFTTPRLKLLRAHGHLAAPKFFWNCQTSGVPQQSWGFTHVKLLEEGIIPFSKTGTRRGIRYQDLMSYRDLRDQESRAAIDGLVSQSQENDMGY